MKSNYFLLLLLVAGLSYGQIINPVSSTTTFAPDFETVLTTVYDGTGLTSFPSVMADHEATSPVNSFVATTITGTIDFDLGGTTDVDGLAFWNQNAGGPSTQYGVNGVRFSSSLDGVTYTLIPGAPTNFAEVTIDPAPPEVFSFPAVSAAFIRMEVTSNHGDVSSGFAEIAFANGVLSITDFEQNSGLSVYPNPATDVIQLTGLTEAKQYTIYNVLGAAIKTGTVNNNQAIQIDTLKSGMYFLTLESGNTVKFIKQ